MELNHLRYFYEVARRNSFTGAARALRISQPSVSKIVKLLEDRENVKLFERGKSGVVLTRTGKKFYDKAEIIFSEIENLKRSLESDQKEVTGILPIAASENFCNYFLLKPMIEFGRKYPKVKLQLWSGTSEGIKNELREKRAELGIFYANPKDPAFDFEKLADIEFQIVCGPKRYDKKKGIQQLATLTYIGSRPADYAKHIPALQLLKSTGLEPKTGLESNSLEVQKRMVLQGCGYAVLPSFMVKEEIALRKLARVPTPSPLRAPAYIVQRKHTPLTRAAELFRSTLVDSFK